MGIELLWWAGCPSHRETLRLLREVVEALGLAEEIELVEIVDQAEAVRECFVGSPTVRVDGHDLFAADDPAPALTCRVYRLRDGRPSPIPDPDDLRDALADALIPQKETSEMTIIGDPAPSFRLTDTAGDEHSLPHAAVTVLVFTCNHCPYALAWHERIAVAAREYRDRGVRFLAINPNDGERYPADSYEAMRDRVERERWPMPYLHDPTQQVARDYGAQTTPDLFLVDADGRIAYRGAADSDHGDPSQNAGWLRAAIEAVLAGRAPDPAETEPVGCTIKWTG